MYGVRDNDFSGNVRLCMSLHPILPSSFHLSSSASAVCRLPVDNGSCPTGSAFLSKWDLSCPTVSAFLSSWDLSGRFGVILEPAFKIRSQKIFSETRLLHRKWGLYLLPQHFASPQERCAHSCAHTVNHTDHTGSDTAHLVFYYSAGTDALTVTFFCTVISACAAQGRPGSPSR